MVVIGQIDMVDKLGGRMDLVNWKSRQDLASRYAGSIPIRITLRQLANLKRVHR
jgi:hypothetical protein